MMQLNSAYSVKQNNLNKKNINSPRVNFKGVSEFTEQDYKDIHSAKVRSAGWSTFFGPLPALIYAFKNPKKAMNPYAEDKQKEYEKQKLIKSAKIKTSLISGVIGSVIEILTAAALFKSKEFNKLSLLDKCIKLGSPINQLIAFATSTPVQAGYWLYIAKKPEKEI